MNGGFFAKSILLGAGLAMDAFSVSLANGLNEPKMKIRKISGTAAMFAICQAVMPMLGWICVHTIARYFVIFEKMIPWIALILLSFIGGKMLIEGLRTADAQISSCAIGFWGLFIQGIATSIDALSVGFTIAGYEFIKAAICALIIAVITFLICFAGVLIGKRFGTKLSAKASVVGGIILIVIGIEIFVTGVF